MDPSWSALALVGAAALVAGVLVRRQPRGRRRTAEEALEADPLDRERDRALTDAIEAANRYNLRPPGR